MNPEWAVAKPMMIGGFAFVFVVNPAVSPTARRAVKTRMDLRTVLLMNNLHVVGPAAETRLATLAYLCIQSQPGSDLERIQGAAYSSASSRYRSSLVQSSRPPM
jgi:hypothetical protein